MQHHFLVDTVSTRSHTSSRTVKNWQKGDKIDDFETQFRRNEATPDFYKLKTYPPSLSKAPKLGNMIQSIVQ